MVGVVGCNSPSVCQHKARLDSMRCDVPVTQHAVHTGVPLLAVD